MPGPAQRSEVIARAWFAAGELKSYVDGPVGRGEDRCVDDVAGGLWLVTTGARRVTATPGNPSNLIALRVPGSVGGSITFPMRGGPGLETGTYHYRMHTYQS